MGKRVLMVSTVPSTIGQFNMNNIQILQKLGCNVDVACDFTDTSIWPEEKTRIFMERMKGLNIDCVQIDFTRSPLDAGRQKAAYRQAVKLLNERHYAFIHTHTPIASAIIRFATHKTGTKAIYTAHGFHFYKGAPFANWMMYYPIEKYLSKYTDTLITITKEDYQRATEKFKAKRTVYVPGVGVDVEKFASDQGGRNKIRNELGIDENQIMLLSVGELNENKNHKAVIQAISGIENLVYVVVGKGELKEELEAAAKENRINLRLTGYRNDVADFYHAADIYILPSLREGLNVSLMEAMASGLPCLCGNIRGNTDLIDEKGGGLFSPGSVTSITEEIKKILNSDRIASGMYNSEKIKEFDLKKVEKLMTEVYQGNL